MKHFLKIFLAALSTTFIFTLTSCSEDKKEPRPGFLQGTAWEVVDADIDEDLIGKTIVFHNDDNFSITPETEWTRTKWSFYRNHFRLIVGDGISEFYMDGKFCVEGLPLDEIFDNSLFKNGACATFSYSWYDCKGKRISNEHYTMTLVKIPEPYL